MPLQGAIVVEESRKEVTTVDTGCTRLEYTSEEENQCISLQFSSRVISATAYPLAKPFDGERPTMPNSVRKISRRAENYHNLPNMLHSQTLKLSTTRQRVRIAVAMCEATIAPDLPTERVNWSSGMSYGGGGVVK